MSRSQLKVNYHTIKYKTLCPVRFVSPTLMEIFSVILAEMFTLTMCRTLVIHFLPIKAGYPSNLAKKISPTEQFPQQILPLLLLYNGYQSLTAMVLVDFVVLTSALFNCGQFEEFQSVVTALVDSMPVFKSVLKGHDSYTQENHVRNILHDEYEAHNAIHDVRCLTCC